MKYKFYLLAIVVLMAVGVVYVSISENQASSENLEKIVSSKGREINERDEIILNDRDFAGKSTPVHTLAKSIIEKLKIKADGSQITTMYDGFGNKTETRFFSGSTRLKCVVIRTSAGGQKQIFVYGQNGEVKTLPANLIDRALTSSANEIADSTGIYATFKGIDKPSMTQKETSPEVLPSNNLPVQTQPLETPVPPENQPTAKTVEPVATPAGKPETAPKENVEKTAPDKNLAEEKTAQSSN